MLEKMLILRPHTRTCLILFLCHVSEHKDNTCDTSVNTKFAKQSAEETLPKLDEIHALSKPVTSNSVSTPQESKGVNNNKVIAPGMFRISPDKVSKEAKKVPNTKCLISVNHDKCLSNYVSGKNSCGKKQKAKVSIKEIQKKYQPKASKPKNVGTRESLATPKPRKSRLLLRWSPTGRMFDHDGKLVASSKSKSQVDCSNGDNACTSNAMEPKIKWSPNSTSLLGRNELVAGLPKFKYHKEHLCPSCEQGKSKRASHPLKPVPNSRQRLHLLHMDLCRPMRIASINGKRYILVIVDDYSCYTWVHFLRSKDKAPVVIITFLKRITVLLQSPVIIIRTDNGT
nr:Gag-Pol polyprotein [Tanacetum cinerariifolium]